ncbi:hypothetical protein BH09BAC3_BH09BAC3_09930 [soil metagenome]
MKQQNNSIPAQKRGFLAMLIGIASGFTFLISLWIGYEGKLNSSSTSAIVVAFCSFLSAVLLFVGRSKMKSCTLTTEVHESHE